MGGQQPERDRPRLLQEARRRAQDRRSLQARRKASELEPDRRDGREGINRQDGSNRRQGWWPEPWVDLDRRGHESGLAPLPRVRKWRRPVKWCLLCRHEEAGNGRRTRGDDVGPPQGRQPRVASIRARRTRRSTPRRGARAPSSLSARCSGDACRDRCIPRSGRRGIGLQRAGKRGTGLRHRLGTRRADVAAQVNRRNGRGSERGLARGPAVPERRTGIRLQGPADRDGRRIRAYHGPHTSDGAVGPNRLQPVDSQERLHVPHDARRHPAGDRCPPAERRKHHEVPDADRILGVRVRQSGRPGKWPRPDREPDGLRCGRREHSGNRMLGRCFQLLRTTAEPRRVRRDRNDRQTTMGRPPQGRHVRHLIRRHQPALRSPTSTARAGGDRTAVSGRCDVGDALSRGHSQHGLRGAVGRRTSARRRTGRSDQRRALGVRTGSERRRDLRGQPGPAWGGDEPARIDQRKLDLPPVGGRSAGPGDVRPQHHCPDVHGVPMARTSRPAGTAPIWLSTSQAPNTSGSHSPTAPTSTRSTRIPSTGSTTSCRSTWRT